MPMDRRFASCSLHTAFATSRVFKWARFERKHNNTSQIYDIYGITVKENANKNFGMYRVIPRAYAFHAEPLDSANVTGGTVDLSELPVCKIADILAHVDPQSTFSLRICNAPCRDSCGYSDRSH